MPGAAVTGPGHRRRSRSTAACSAADFKRVRPPIREFMLLGGMMVGKDDIPRLIGRFRSAANFFHSAKLFAPLSRRSPALSARHAHDHGQRAGRAAVLQPAQAQRAGAVRCGDHRAHRRSATASPARACAPAAKTSSSRRARAWCWRPAATAHNKAFREKFMPQPTPPAFAELRRQHAATASRSGEQLGACVVARALHQRPVDAGLDHPRPDGSEGLYPHLSLDRAKPGLIAVNAAGRRFVNEALFLSRLRAGDVREPQGGAVDPRLADLRRGLHRQIRSRRHPSRHARSTHSSKRSGYLVERPTRSTSSPPRSASTRRRWREPVARHNGFAETGVDVDFGKGETELNRFNGDPAHKPNPCLGPIGDAARSTPSRCGRPTSR